MERCFFAPKSRKKAAAPACFLAVCRRFSSKPYCQIGFAAPCAVMVQEDYSWESRDFLCSCSGRITGIFIGIFCILSRCHAVRCTAGAAAWLAAAGISAAEPAAGAAVCGNRGTAGQCAAFCIAVCIGRTAAQRAAGDDLIAGRISVTNAVDNI